ncbi:TonB-dependent receptor [Colwelliaceae bacterium BS250]
MHIQRSNGKINKITLALIAAISGGSYSTVAVAEEQIAQDKNIEVILVKGGKRPKTLQQVAASVSVIGGNEMKQMKVENLEDVSASIPNVSISANAIQDTISIRGINSDLQSGGEQSVGIFVDGVYHGRGVQSRFSFLDVETLEVLRGPQGALFGKNTIAGVISINPAQAKEELEGKITVGYETEAERMETSGFVTGALNESGSLTGRLAFKYADSDEGFIENVAKDTTGVTVTDYAYRGILNWQFDEQLTFNLRAEQGNQETNGIYWEMTQVEAYDPNLAPIVGAYQFFGTEGEVNHQGSASQMDYPGLGYNGKDTSSFMDTNFDEYALKTNYALDAGNLTLVLANSGYDFERSVDADFGPLPLLQYSDTEDYEQNSAEIRFVSNDSDSFEYIVGLYYQDADLEFGGVTDAATSQTSIVGNLFNSNMPMFEMALGLPAGALANVYPQYDITSRFNKIDQNTETFALFGQVGVGITDNVKLEVSARYSEEDKTATQSVELFGGTGYGAQSGNALLNPIENAFWGAALFEATPHEFDLSRSESHFSPSASLSWTVSDDATLYSSYSKGFKSGGFNALAMGPNPEDAEYEEEEANSYEIGGKFTLLDGSANLNIAIFSTEFKDMQTTVFTGGTTFVVDNAAEATSQGLELDFKWNFTEEWTVYSTFGYIDFEFDSYLNAGCTAKQMFDNGLNGAQCAAAGINDLSGRTNQDVPEFTTMLGLQYDTMVGEYQLVSRVNVNYLDDYYAAGDLDEASLVEGYALVDASVKLISPDEDWDVAFIARNLTDEEYYYYHNDTPLLGGTHHAATSAPATYNIQLSYYFMD